MNNDIWNKWITDWNWILKIAQNQGWEVEQLEIKPKINTSEIAILEKKYGISYPIEFKKILINYSSGVKFGWQTANEEIEGEFDEIFSGCGGVSEYKENSYLWDFGLLSDIYLNYQGWLKDCYNDPTDNYGKHYYDKIPFIEVPNSDLIVFNSLGQVIYLSHDDGPLHGEKLADSFIEFITLWSKLGCVGTESEQFSVFYDRENMKLMDNSPKIDRWRDSLEK